MPGRTARVSSTTLRSVRFTARSHASQSCVSNVPAGGPPAFVTRTSTRPNFVERFARHALDACARSERSATTACTCDAARRCDLRRAASSASAPRAQMHERRAFARQLVRDRAAKSAARRGDERDLSAQSEIHRRYFRRYESVLFEPVLARRIEDVDVERVLERLGLVRNVRRNVQHFARAHDARSCFSSSPIQNFSAPSRIYVICSFSCECLGTMQPFLR